MAVYKLIMHKVFPEPSRPSGQSYHTPDRSMMRLLALACCWAVLALLNIPASIPAQDTPPPDLIDRIDSRLELKPFGPDFQWGLVGYHIAFPSYRLRPDDLERMAKAGIEWLNIDFAWRDIEPMPGQFTFDYYDMIVQEAQRHGLRILGRIGNGFAAYRPTTPDWAQHLDDQAYNVALQKYAEATVARYKDHIEQYALENEANLAEGQAQRGQRRTGTWTQERVVSVWKTLSDTIRHLDPNDLIVLSLSDAPALKPWLDAAAAGGVSYDRVGFQSYVCGFVPAQQCRAALLPKITSAIQLSGKDVVMLETGFCPSSDLYSPEKQADYVETMVKTLRHMPIKGVFFYEYLESPDEPTEGGRHCGFVHNDRTPKPAWLRLQEMLKRYKQAP